MDHFDDNNPLLEIARKLLAIEILLGVIGVENDSQLAAANHQCHSPGWMLISEASTMN